MTRPPPLLRFTLAAALGVGLVAVASAPARATPGKKDPTKKDPTKKDPVVAPTPPPPVPPPPPPPPAEPPPKDHRRIVGILDVKVEGVPPEIAAQFQRDLEAQVDTKHYWLAPKSRMHDLMTNSTKWIDGCVVGPCLREAKSQANADLVLLAALTGAGTSFGYVVTLVRTDTGRVLAQEAERCDVCTLNEALTNATLATVKILNAVPDALPDEEATARALVAAANQTAHDDVAAAHHHHAVTGAALTIAGVATAAAGAALYATQHHASYGLATASIGGGLAVGGVCVLTF